MAESDFVFAVHSETKIVAEVPREHVEIYEQLTELSEDEVRDLRAGEASAISGSEDSEPSDSWLKAELQAYADLHGVEYESTATKAEILDAISAQEGDK